MFPLEGASFPNLLCGRSARKRRVANFTQVHATALYADTLFRRVTVRAFVSYTAIVYETPLGCPFGEWPIKSKLALIQVPVVFSSCKRICGRTRNPLAPPPYGKCLPWDARDNTMAGRHPRGRQMVCIFTSGINRDYGPKRFRIKHCRSFNEFTRAANDKRAAV